MPDIQAFRGLRYDLGHVGSLSDVVAPPYDVIDNELSDALHEKHPANVVRLILDRIREGDTDQNNRYTRAARQLKTWRGDGTLATEPDPALYVYHQIFTHDGVDYTRRGFMCRVRLEPFGEGKIYPHEETHAGAKADRLKLTQACRANLSQIFGIYPAAESEAQNILEAEIAGVAPTEATDHLGVVHRIWPVTNVEVISRLTAVMGPKPMFIADGHHRYETACNYRDHLAAAGNLENNHPAHCVLMQCVGMNDPGMIVLPTYRLFRGLPEITSEELISRLGDCFTCNVAGEGPEHAGALWSEIEVEDEQGTLGLYTAADDRWVLAKITDTGEGRMAEIAEDHSQQWQGLGVSILHRLVIDTLLGATDLPKCRYVRLVEELVEGLRNGDTDGSRFPLAALVMPATLEHVRVISEQAERMPAKSTYFYPKLLSGLVINPLE